MSIMITEPAAKTPRRRSAKPPRQEEANKVKATIHISEKAMKMLGVYAVMTASSNSAVVENLIVEHLRRFVVSDRAKSADEVVPVTSAI